MMNNAGDYESLAAHLSDLKDKSETWHQSLASSFLNEEEQAAMQKLFPESALVRYDGGYPGARKKKVIFLRDEEDDFSDIVCISADTDQRFRSIGHRDILGALMSLQIDRHRPWTEPGCVEILDAVQPKYLTHELSSGPNRPLFSAVKRQLHTIQKGYSR